MAKDHHQQTDLQVSAGGNGGAGESGVDASSAQNSPIREGGAAGAQGDAGGADDELEKVHQELEATRSRLASQQEAVMRAHAELENVRKRTLRDVENAHKFALDRFIADLLPVLDSMELGIAAAGSAEDADSLREGMDLILKKFQDTLARFGVTTIDPTGEKFNPERHEAVSMQEIAGTPPGTVVTVMQKGYELNGRLVRPAMVVVAR